VASAVMRMPKSSDGLPFLEGDVVELPVELLHAGIARAFITDL
jgi:hypothetical protein